MKQAIRKSRILYNRWVKDSAGSVLSLVSHEPLSLSPVVCSRGVNNDELISEHKTALMKYSKDLTALAKAGKLDPCIGRNDELRR